LQNENVLKGGTKWWTTNEI